MNKKISKLISVKEFSEKYGFGLNKSYEIVNSEKFPVIRCGRKYLIIEDKIDDWIYSNIGKSF